MTPAEYKQSIEFLRESCPAFQRYERDLIQHVVDQLSAVNCLIEASITHETFPSQQVPTKRLQEIQKINQAVMERVRK